MKKIKNKKTGWNDPFLFPPKIKYLATNFLPNSIDKLVYNISFVALWAHHSLHERTEFSEHLNISSYRLSISSFANLVL